MLKRLSKRGDAEDYTVIMWGVALLVLAVAVGIAVVLMKKDIGLGRVLKNLLGFGG